MRAKPSSTASETDRRSCASAEMNQQEGLLHDARNLMGAIGLYCDLLSMPGVLQPEHHGYAEELRLLGTRSGALIQHLMEQRMPSSYALEGAEEGPGTGAAWEAGVARSLALVKVRAARGEPDECTVHVLGSGEPARDPGAQPRPAEPGGGWQDDRGKLRGRGLDAGTGLRGDGGADSSEPGE